MVAGHLQEKRGYFYIVLNYKDSNGKRKTKWIATSLPIKGNKRKADELLQQARLEFKPEAEEPKPEAPAAAVPVTVLTGDVLFADFMLSWLDVIKRSVSPVTFSSYSGMVKSITVPYFRKTGIRLSALKPRDIQAFYDEKIKTVSANSVIHYHANIHKALDMAVKLELIPIKTVSANSVIHYHANIHKALDMAVKLELIPNNPSDHVELPKKARFVGSFYNSDELNELFAAAKGTNLEIPVLFGAFYGLRRSEVVGLKWDAIDFENNTITIRHTVTSCRIDGKKVMVAADRTKNKSSMRTLPLVPFFKERLLYLQDQQNKHRRLCGRSYCREYLGYICVDEIGVLIKPDYISAAFPKLLDRHGLRRIRFHDLRHSCASLLLAHGVPMKQIQEWLGHSDFSTTANIYSHLDYTAKLNSAETLVNSLDFVPEPKPLPG